MDDELKEKLVNALKMWPSWLNLFLLLHSCLSELEVGFLEVWQGSENVLFNHGHHIVKTWNNNARDCLWLLQQLLDLVDSIQSFCLLLHVL